MSDFGVTLLRAADRRATIWKNGGGVTHEVAISPSGASINSFDWRVSLARVESDGPFSSFAGVDRYCAVLEGDMSLRVGDAEPMELRPGMPPVKFSGDVPTSAKIRRGPVTDLNVFARRGRASATVLSVQFFGAYAGVLHGSTSILIARTAGLTATCDPWPPTTLSVNDALRIDGAAGRILRLESPSPAEVYVVEVTTG